VEGLVAKRHRRQVQPGPAQAVRIRARRPHGR